MENKTMKFSSKEVFSIPNILGYFRILLIPFFCYFYIKEKWSTATIVLLISTVTDFLDGQIARRCNMITEFGKILDPIADKLTHFAIALCLTFRYNLMIVLLILMVIKESYMAVKGLISLKTNIKLSGAKWYGKICTAALFLSLAYLVLLTNISLRQANIIITSQIIIMCFTFLMYILEYVKINNQYKTTLEEKTTE